ncbi:MAG: hypothetical protein KDL87_02110 [Verrucomicrobiae bacterium]|nr:hypothetical protein [Verrucomicrobiae bacterium]
MKLFNAFTIVIASALIASWTGFAKPPGRGLQAAGHGKMSDDFRGVIHSLFASHESVDRSVDLTKTGYRATTTSSDPKVAKMLQEHVAQMASRLDEGLSVRHWDPAFVEMREHYDDMAIEVKNVSGGVAVSVVGKTPEAVKVAQNHARIIDGFVKKGGEEMHAIHARALEDGAASEASTTTAGPACGDSQCGKGDKPCCAARAEKKE